MRQPRFPSVLAEIGYHDNYADAVCGWRATWDAIAQQLARALTEYFGLPFIYPMEPAAGDGGACPYGTLNLRERPSPGPGRVMASLPCGRGPSPSTASGRGGMWCTTDGQVGYAAAGVHRLVRSEASCRLLEDVVKEDKFAMARFG